MFCPSCGNPLPEDARFCGACGAKIENEVKAAVSIAAPDRKERPAEGKTSEGKKAKRAGAAKAAKAAVNAAAPEATEKAKAKAVEAAKAIAPELLRFDAPAEGGELTLGTLGPSLSDASQVISGPLKVIGGSLKSFFASLAAAVKDPKSLIPALALAVIWAALDILKDRGIEPAPLKVLSFLTFANGGMEGGTAGFLGGLLGKGLFAGAAASVTGALTQKREGEKRALAGVLKEGFGLKKDALWAWLAGFGAALLLYLFFSGGALKMSFMAGAAAAYLAARAAMTDGFLKKLLSSVAARGREAAGPGAAGVIRGMACGFAAAALLALGEKRLLLLIPGGILLLGGAVMTILQATKVGKKREPEQQENNHDSDKEESP
jgi:hypothetical protein